MSRYCDEKLIALEIRTPTTKALTGATKSVTTAGTPVAIVASSKLVMSCMMQANPANTGNIYVYLSGTKIHTLGPDANNPGSIDLSRYIPPGFCIDLATITIDADNSGEGVAFGYMEV